MEMEKETVTIAGKEYTLRFASLRQGKKLADLLGFKLLRDSIKNIDWIALLEDDGRTLSALKLMIEDEIDDSILDVMKAGDITFLVTTFFLKIQEVSLTPSNGTKFLADTINGLLRNPLKLREDSNSMLPSSMPQTESQN